MSLFIEGVLGKVIHKWRGFTKLEVKTMRILKRYLLSMVVAFCGVFVGNANAQTSLLADGFVSNSGDALELAGDTYTPHWSSYTVGSAWIPFTADSTVFSGEVGSWVYSGTGNANDFNPYGTGGLTFLYQFKHDFPGLGTIERMTVDNFSNFLTSVAWTYQLSGVSMSGMSRSSDGDTIGVDWNGVPGVSPGGYGHMIVFTNATAYGDGTARFIDGGIASAAVLTPVPEPETYAMLLAGLGLMGFVARRRQRKLAAA